MAADVFVPHAHCTVASGDCFTQGKCLRACKEQHTRDQDKRIAALEARMRELEQLVYRRQAAARSY